MPRRARSRQVSFYVVEPRDLPGATPAPTFESGAFPVDEVLDMIGSLDIASGDFYMETSFFDQVVCFVHGQDPRILGAYTKDVLTAPMTEYKGELGRLPLREDEGIVDPTFVAFFPNSVAGVLRSSVKAPGAKTVADYISQYTGHRCRFQPLPHDAGAARAQLDRPDPSMFRLVVKAKRAVFSRLRDSDSEVARALEAAGRITNSGVVKLELAPAGVSEWRAWWETVEPSVHDLIDIVSDLDVAKIEVKGDNDDINLKRDFVTVRVPVEIDEGRLTVLEGTRALLRAYGHMEEAIIAALASWRAVHRG